jgi:hypothetical protein
MYIAYGVMQISNLSKVDRRKGPRVNGRQLYGIFNGDFRVGSYVMKLKLLDVEADAEETVQEVKVDGSVVVLRLLAGKPYTTILYPPVVELYSLSNRIYLHI